MLFKFYVLCLVYAMDNRSVYDVDFARFFIIYLQGVRKENGVFEFDVHYKGIVFLDSF